MSMSIKDVRRDIEQRQQTRLLQRTIPSQNQNQAVTQTQPPRAQMPLRGRSLGEVLGMTANSGQAASQGKQGEGKGQLSKPSHSSYHSPLAVGGIEQPQLNQRAKGMTM